MPPATPHDWTIQTNHKGYYLQNNKPQLTVFENHYHPYYHTHYNMGNHFHNWSNNLKVMPYVLYHPRKRICLHNKTNTYRIYTMNDYIYV